MKNLYSYKEFLTEKNQLNEGLFSWLKGLFKDLQNYAKKVKESGEIDKKIEVWKKDLDKIIDEKKNDIKDSETPEQSGSTQSTGATNASYKYQGTDLIKEAEEVKKDIPDMPEFIKNLGKEKSTGNAIDDAINQFLDNKKAELMPYINSDIKATRLYVYAKLAELNTHILNQKIEIYKAKKGKEKELKAAQEKLKILENDSKELQNGLKSELGDVSKDFKEGDTVIYKRDKWDKNAEEIWNKLSDKDKKNPDKLKDMLDKEYIGQKPIVKINGDEIDFGDFKKQKDEILGEISGQVQGKDELVNTLKDLKSKNPEAIKKISKVASMYKEPDKNKEKIAQIQKQFGSQEQ